jgi:hypothetical protein
MCRWVLQSTCIHESLYKYNFHSVLCNILEEIADSALYRGWEICFLILKTIRAYSQEWLLQPDLVIEARRFEKPEKV